MIVILDNRDSFVHNVEHRLAKLGVASQVVPSHATRLDEIAALRPTELVISPGREDAGRANSLDGRDPHLRARRAGARHLPRPPVHRGRVRRAGAARRACHGRSSPIAHDGAGLLAGVPAPFDAGRYHALAADEPAPDAELVVSARLAEDRAGW